MDTIVFDIETQNFFTDENVGRDNFAALKISVVALYSYDKDKYFSFLETEIGEIMNMMRQAGRIVGFSSNRYDIPVLNLYFERYNPKDSDYIDGKFDRVDLWKKERIDLLDEIELATGSRISLDRLAEANLDFKKTHHSWEAISLYKEGKIDELRDYCINDVRITKELYDLWKNNRALLVPNRKTGENKKILFSGQVKLF
jgi:DEAD/DEAH box helicase domain-containing protein